ncbi:MAG: hypothetical protein R3E02_04310 [Blastomonas sp.]
MVRTPFAAFKTRPALPAIALALALSLSACGSSEAEGDAADADAALLDDAQDPAMTGALEDQILVDPDLVDQSNQNAVLGQSGNDGLPSGTAPKGAAAAGKAAAEAELSGTKMLSAPEPRVVSAEECKDCSQGVTLGAKAEMQQGGKGSCNAKLTYAMGWANRMPEAFKVYPRANVKEAAGFEGGSCNVRVVNFTTPVALKNVVDYYYTKARRSGYTAEYQLRDGEHVLGGVNESTDGAYVLFLRPMSNGGTEVDIVANNGA